MRGQVRDKLKKFKTKDLFTKGIYIQQPNLVENRGEIKKIDIWRSTEDKNENIQDQGLR